MNETLATINSHIDFALLPRAPWSYGVNDFAVNKYLNSLFSIQITAFAFHLDDCKSHIGIQ